MKRRLLLATLAATLAGCARPRLPTPPEPYALRLPPASLGRDLVLQQRMSIAVGGFRQQLDVALEVDAEAVRMAVMAFGQTVARLEWDGRQLRETRARGWPSAVSGGRVLSDLQLVHWPVDAIRAGLPFGLQLDADGTQRVLRSGSTTIARVRYPGPGIAELDNLAGHYSLRLESGAAS